MRPCRRARSPRRGRTPRTQSVVFHFSSRENRVEADSDRICWTTNVSSKTASHGLRQTGGIRLRSPRPPARVETQVAIAAQNRQQAEKFSLWPPWERPESNLPRLFVNPPEEFGGPAS